jgi:hypothetical protein
VDTSPTVTDGLWFLRTALGRTDSQLHATDVIVPLVRSFVLGPGVTGACDVVGVTSPPPCARLPHVFPVSLDCFAVL